MHGETGQPDSKRNTGSRETGSYENSSGHLVVCRNQRQTILILCILPPPPCPHLATPNPTRTQQGQADLKPAISPLNSTFGWKLAVGSEVAEPWGVLGETVQT